MSKAYLIPFIIIYFSQNLSYSLEYPKEINKRPLNMPEGIFEGALTFNYIDLKDLYSTVTLRYGITDNFEVLFPLRIKYAFLKGKLQLSAEGGLYGFSYSEVRSWSYRVGLGFLGKYVKNRTAINFGLRGRYGFGEKVRDFFIGNIYTGIVYSLENFSLEGRADYINQSEHLSGIGEGYALSLDLYIHPSNRFDISLGVSYPANVISDDFHLLSNSGGYSLRLGTSFRF